MVMTDPYSILGVPRTASAAEIRAAYRKLAKALHPDARPNDKAAEERFKQVTAAFKILSDEKTRGRFDRGEIDGEGRERPPFHFRSRPGGGASQKGPSGRFEDLGDVFSDLFTDFGAQNGRRHTAQGGRGGHGYSPAQGADIKRSVTLSFLEAAHGTKRRVTVAEGKVLDVTIPEGVEDGRVLRLKGQGEPGAMGGQSGALLLEIRVEPHAVLKREGADIRLDLPVDLKEALFGAKVRVPTLDGPVDVRVPAGANSGTLLRLRGKGVKSDKGERGDQIIRILVDIPLNDPALEAFIETWNPPTDYTPRRRFDG